MDEVKKQMPKTRALREAREKSGPSNGFAPRKRIPNCKHQPERDRHAHRIPESHANSRSVKVRIPKLIT